MMMGVCDNRSLNTEWTVSTRQHGPTGIHLYCSLVVAALIQMGAARMK